MQPVEAVPICCVALTSRSDPEENNLFHGDERPGGYEDRLSSPICIPLYFYLTLLKGSQVIVFTG